MNNRLPITISKTLAMLYWLYRWPGEGLSGYWAGRHSQWDSCQIYNTDVEKGHEGLYVYNCPS